MNKPNFKPNFKYQNVGVAVGQLNYSKPMTRQDGSEYGTEYLVSAKGFGSINVRLPHQQNAQQTNDAYYVSERPRVRANLTTLTQFRADSGKVYTNLETFQAFTEPVDYSGQPMEDGFKGRVEGEVHGIRQVDDVIKFFLTAYRTDKEGKLVTSKKDGAPLQPDTIEFEIHDQQVKQQFMSSVGEGSNVGVGYRYLNKSNITYDEFGFPQGDGKTIEYVEAAKIIVHSASGTPQPGNNQGGFSQPNQQQGFNQQPNVDMNMPTGMNQGQQQQNGFNQQTNNQNSSFANPNNNPFDPNSDPLNYSIQQDQMAQQAQQYFPGQGVPGANPFMNQ